jgi:hypothetical protein
MNLLDLLPTRSEVKVAVYDLRRRLAGICNDAPWLMGPNGRGGYSHWRCQLRAGHGTLHRFNNYTWGDDTQTRTTHDAVPVGIKSPGAWRLPEVPGFARSYRQRREHDAFMRSKYDWYQPKARRRIRTDSGTA